MMITILEASEKTNISKDKCRYWLKLLKQDTVKKDGKLFFPDVVTDILTAMKKAVDSGMQPAAAATEVKSTYVRTIAPKSEEKSLDNEKLLQKISELEKSVLLMAKMLEKQNKQISIISKKLDPPKKQNLVIWHPKKPKRPEYSIIKRFWYELTNPVKLRAI